MPATDDLGMVLGQSGLSQHWCSCEIYITRDASTRPPARTWISYIRLASASKRFLFLLDTQNQPKFLASHSDYCVVMMK